MSELASVVVESASTTSSLLPSEGSGLVSTIKSSFSSSNSFVGTHFYTVTLNSGSSSAGVSLSSVSGFSSCYSGFPFCEILSLDCTFAPLATETFVAVGITHNRDDVVSPTTADIVSCPVNFTYRSGANTCQSQSWHFDLYEHLSRQVYPIPVHAKEPRILWFARCKEDESAVLTFKLTYRVVGSRITHTASSTVSRVHREAPVLQSLHESDLHYEVPKASRTSQPSASSGQSFRK